MNTQEILNVAGKYISGIKEVKSNIFKGTLTVANKLAGVYYFDLNNQVLEDFEAYQETLLAEEFYAHPGNLQWNYYLFMLNDQLAPKAKDNIEKNDKYARKYVLTESEFNDFFTLEKSDAAIRPNIVAEWKRRLDEVGLQDVYSLRSYVDMVAQFKDAGNAPLKKVQARREADDSDKINFINRLVLQESYRPYPVQRQFSFGKVNLFQGINGAGKTSLFEAIEAMICGKCLRNPGVTMPQGCIEAEFNGSNKLISYSSTNNRMYIDRDLNWYATNSRNNTLYNSFNRFNFFNADAAYNFSIATTEKEASEALFSIILGPEYHYISERNVGTLERLRPEFNRLKEEMRVAREQEKRTGLIIKNYKEPASVLQLREAVQATYRKINFKNAQSSEEASVIEERNNHLRPILKSLLANDGSVLTMRTFKNIYREFEEKRRQLVDKETELRTLTEKQTALNAEEKRLNSAYEFLSRCISYIRDEQLMKLEGLQARESAVNLQKSKMTIVKDLIGNGSEINPIALKSSTDEIQTAIEVTNGEIKAREQEMAEIMNALGQLATLIRQIKSHGRELLSLDHNVAECPLCQAGYTRTELEQRINRESSAAKADQPVDFDALREQIERSKKTLQEYQSALQDQRKIDQAHSTAFPGETATKHAAALIRIQSFTKSEDDIAQEIYELAELKKYADSSGRSEKEYNELKFAYTQNFPDGPGFAYGQAIEFQKLLDNTTTAANKCKSEIDENDAARILVGNEIKRMLGVEGTSIYLKDIKELFHKQETGIIGIKNALDKLKELIEVDELTPISQIYELAETLQHNIVSLREEQKVQFEYETAQKDYSNAKAFVETNETRLIRYEQAVETLRALTGDEASAHVTTFFNDNFQEIVDIFKSIHVPKEFKTLKYNDDRLELITDTGEARSISQISTGQRSALALSIFLSLNGKLRNGPDIIMFDDPVAFIDDLNALSFLDHLRIHILRTHRQIFFATANMRLAGLFEKKFGFLGDDFKKFKIERTAGL